MKGKYLPAIATLLYVAGASFSPAQAKGTEHAGCDRSCLDGVMGQYLAAMVAHDPSKAPLSRTVRSTENTIPLKPGTGLWWTMTGVSSYRLQFADPKTGTSVFFGRIMEQGAPRYVAIRLKVAERAITEAEMIVARNIKLPFDGTVEASRPIFTETLAEASRMSRPEMLKIPEKYGMALVAGNGKLAPFAEDCARMENGMHTTGAPGLLPPTPRGLDIAGMNCGDQISTNVFDDSTNIEPRIWMVDEERGVVVALMTFQSDGRTTELSLTNGEKLPPLESPSPGYSFIAEAFRVADGKIHQIEAVFGAPYAYGSPSGW